MRCGGDGFFQKGINSSKQELPRFNLIVILWTPWKVSGRAEQPNARDIDAEINKNDEITYAL